MVANLWKTCLLNGVSTIMFVTLAFMISDAFRSSVMLIGFGIFLLFVGAILMQFLQPYAWAKYMLFANIDLTQYISGQPYQEGMTLGFSIAVLNRPAGDEAMAGLAAHDMSLAGGGYDMIFAYALDMDALRDVVTDVIGRERLSEGGYLYAAYPKKGNKVYPTYIHRDSLFEGFGADEDGYIGTSSLKFARMVGLDDIFTVVGFKLESRRPATSSSASTKPSQRVDDYVALIPNVEQDLAYAPEALAMYRTLTIGYRKNWARYVYSAVQEDTREKRRAEMKDILSAGYKSVDLYRRR